MNASDEYSGSFQQHVLLEAVDPADPILQDYVRRVVPKIINRLGTMSAKGGKAFLEKCRAAGYHYQDKPDQSMVAHILNGIFPVRRIMRELEQRQIRQFTELEQKLYLCAYTLHDTDKLAGEKDLYDIGSEDARTHLKSILDEWVSTLNINAFFPDYQEYRDDLIYLILNTQEKYGVDVLPYNYGVLRLPARRRDIIRDLCNLSDVLSYLDQHGEGTMFTSPANLCQGKPDKPRKLLASLSNGQLTFAYHQLSEVTGLLSNFINNGVMHLMEAQGSIPLLFFPHGVVYLGQTNSTGMEISDDLYEQIVSKISNICKLKVRQDLIGCQRDKTLKFADYYHQIFSIRELMEFSVEMINRKIINPKSQDRLAKLKSSRKKWKIPDHIDINFEPSLEIDKLAEFWGTIETILEKIKGVVDVDQIILESLSLLHLLETSRSIPDKGGPKFRWYVIAGKYLQQHPGLDAEEITGLMKKTAQAVVDRFRVQIEKHESEQGQFPMLRSYIATITDLNGIPRQEERNFSRELHLYSSAKKLGRGKELICSLCSTPYNATHQQEAATPFQPQVYSNKQPLNKQANRRGICKICSLELMLRQILMKSLYQRTGANFENQKVKYLYIYPNYYFTTETAKYVAKLYQDSINRLSSFNIVRKLGRLPQFQIEDLLHLEDFKVELDEDEKKKPSSFIKMEFPKNDLATLFFFGIPSIEKKPTDTDSWISPAFLALALPFIFTAKVVVSEFPLPLYTSGNDFRETVILDAPHHFLHHIFRQDRFRVDEVLPMLQILTVIYAIHLDVYSDKNKPNWSKINEVVANLDTDIMAVFHYLMKWQRKKKIDKISSEVASRYLNFYKLLQQVRKEEQMSMFQELVDHYYTFYHPDGFNSHSIVRPISQIITDILNADKDLPEEDLALEIIGALKGVQDRVHTRQAKGFAPIGGYDEVAAIRKFVEYFYHDVFLKYCRGERALLRERANRIKYGCEAYYLETYAPRKKEKKTDEENEVTMV